MTALGTRLGDFIVSIGMWNQSFMKWGASAFQGAWAEIYQGSTSANRDTSNRWRSSELKLTENFSIISKEFKPPTPFLCTRFCGRNLIIHHPVSIKYTTHIISHRNHRHRGRSKSTGEVGKGGLGRRAIARISWYIISRYTGIPYHPVYRRVYHDAGSRGI